ncbi:MAG: SbcC/MukB-like Walker B domain-containing protein [Cruoricaptor ignavus]|nr:SbcC/MukB-like Walker B domain-containing protein [Cruoricaptor ignavus]
MKILNLKFKNINSLSGENEIDFTKPAFTNDGLFAITGKTGAGKSSILDAISLAIYGKTPRVEITGNENAVMTRGEKDCYAEVLLEVAEKKWKFSWKQELNRNGKLKPINRQIATFDNKIVADQVRSCDKKILEILGLTFEQFTKVIMLAQGSFAAFLQADKNDKGELLEQITGTEIYGEISKKVFERTKIEREKLNKIIVELDAIKMLSEEEISKIEEEISIFNDEKKQADNQLNKIEIAKKWITDLDILQKQIGDAKQNLPELEIRLNTENELFSKSVEAFNSIKKDWELQEPILKKVRELDTKIVEKEKQQKPILETIFKIKTEKKQLSDKLTMQKGNLENRKIVLSEKKSWAENHRKYEHLVTDYKAIENDYLVLEEHLAEIKNLNSQIDKLVKNQDYDKQKLDETQKILNKKIEIFNKKNDELNLKKKQLDEVLSGKEIAIYQSEKERITNFGTELKNLIEIEIAVKENQKEIKSLDEKLKQNSQSETQVLAQIKTEKERVSHFEHQIKLLKDNIQLTKTIQSLDEHRHELKDGEACPLCGATEHPFALGNVPQLGEKEQELQSSENSLKEVEKSLKYNENILMKISSDKENFLLNKEKENKKFSDNLIKQEKNVFQLMKINPKFSIPNDGNKIDILQNILDNKRKELKEINLLINKSTEIEKQISELRDMEIPTLMTEKQSIEKQFHQLESDYQVNFQTLKIKQNSVIEQQEKYNNKQKILNENLKKYDAENIEILKTQLENWNENEKLIDDLAKEISALENQINIDEKEWGSHIKYLEEKEAEQQNIEQEKQKLSDERKDIFGEKSVEEEEFRLKKLLENTEKEKKSIEEKKNETNTKLEKNKAIISEKEKDFEEQQSQNITNQSLDELQELFNQNKMKAEELSQKIGANRQTLKANNEMAIANSKKLKEKEKQKKQGEKWEKLNELIGSADGKKYRNFAQALTFEHLINLANRQLYKMTDRYILKRMGDHTNPFELSVIDKFQNSEERTAQNLSGGEKFIVSLALALGLSGMAGKNMQIDTMFIDEGFGTLDSDYLDVALTALSNLQSEGKIIGVISHLSELKERIATHIEVVPSGNGHSKIQIMN